MKFCFGDIVIIEENLIGVIVKCWTNLDHNYNYDIYVREFDNIKNYEENEIQRYMVRHKYLDEQELEWQNNVLKN